MLYLRISFIIFISIIAALGINAQNSKNPKKWTLNTKISNTQEEVFIVVEQMPLFPTCETVGLSNAEKKLCSFEALDKYVAKRIGFDKDDNGKLIEGVYLVSFIIDKNGKTSDITLERPIENCDYCNEELLQIFNKMPAWIPGRQRNRKVNVLYKYVVKIGQK